MIDSLVLSPRRRAAGGAEPSSAICAPLGRCCAVALGVAAGRTAANGCDVPLAPPARGPLLALALSLACLAATARAQAPEPAGAPVAALGRVVALDQLLAFAREHAGSLRVAERRRGLAAAAQVAAGQVLRDNPELELAAGPRVFGGGDVGLEFAAALSQRIEIAGERGLRLTAAERYRQRLGLESERARFELELALVAAYRGAQLALSRFELVRRQQQLVTELVAVVQRRVEAGDASAIDLHLAQADEAEARAHSSLALEDMLARSIELAELSGWPANQPLPRPVPQLTEAPAAPPLTPLLAAAARAHPELQVQRAALAQARAEVAVAEREAWPAPAFGVQVAREAPDPAADQAAEWVVLGQLSLPLPFWQHNQAGRARARAEAALADAELDEAARRLQLALRRAHAELVAAAERQQLVAASAAAAARGLELLQRGFDAGELDLSQVRPARERFVKTQLEALSARADQERAWIALQAAFGRPISLTGEIAP